MTLYEIEKSILECVDWETGEIIDAEKLSQLQMAREEKIENVALWIKDLNAEINAYKAEKEAFAEREAKTKAKVESLKKWLTAALQGENFKTSRVAVSFRKSEAVEIDEDDFDMVIQPAEYLTHKPPVPNKTAIKAAIKSGKDVAGATLVVKQNIQIK